MTRPRASAAEWTNRVQAWRASGESADEYARQHGWNSGTLRWWSRRIGRSPTAESKAAGFVRLVERRDEAGQVAGPHGGAIEVVLGRGRSVRVTCGADLELLRAVVQALEVQ